MDGLKEVLSAFETRIRSKVVSSVVLAFIALNWRALFYLLFAKKTVEEKFVYFNEGTTDWSLLYLPAFFGVLFSIILPWVNFVGMKMTFLAESKQHELKNESQYLDKLSKSKYEAQIEEEKAKRRTAIVTSAKAKEEAKAISDPEVRREALSSLKTTETSNSDNLKDKNSSSPIKLSLGKLLRTKDYSDVPVESFEDAINSLNSYLNSKNKNLKTLEEEKLSFSQTQKEASIIYKEQMAKLRKNNDPKSIESLKLIRAKELEAFKLRRAEIGKFIALAERSIKKMDRDKQTLVTALDEKYGFDKV